MTISVNKGAPAPKNENKGSVIKGTTKKMCRCVEYCTYKIPMT